MFLGGEGIIGRFRGSLRDARDFELLETAGQAVRRINESGFLVIALVGRSGADRVTSGWEKEEEIGRKIQTLLGRQGAYLDDALFFSYYPERKDPEEIRESKAACRCGKTVADGIGGMAVRYHMDLSKSYMIGADMAAIQTGIHSGMRTVLAGAGQAGMDGGDPIKPDLKVENLLRAVELILEEAGCGESAERTGEE